MDLIGPYKIRRKDKTELICRCVTLIDPATGWFELQQYDDKRAISVANIVEQQWLCRYPWPTKVTVDRGSEFIGKEFKNMITNDYGSKIKYITTRNPQANAIVERVHQVIGNMVRTFELHDHYLDEEEPWAGVLQAVAFAIRATYHTTLQKTPGQLVFGRDMIFDVQHTANWEFIRQRKQEIINKNNQRENSKRRPHKYQEGDQILVRKGTENKYEQPQEGPFVIQQVFNNGTVQIQKGAVTETINIRQAIPFLTHKASNQGGVCNMCRSKRIKTKKNIV